MYEPPTGEFRDHLGGGKFDTWCVITACSTEHVFPQKDENSSVLFYGARNRFIDAARMGESVRPSPCRRASRQ